MNFSRRILPLLAIIGGCANQVKEGSRLEQVYPFSSTRTIAYKKENDMGDGSLKGSIKFEKSKIYLLISNEGEEVTDECSIRTVTYEEDPTHVKYRTDKGDFVVKVKNDTIREVTLFTDQFLTTFDRRQESRFTATNLPITLADVKKGWTRILMKEVGSIDIPPILEIQSAKYKSDTKERRENLEKAWKVELDDPKVVIQQKGLNDSNSNAIKRYARIITDISYGKPGEFNSLNQWKSLSAKELERLNTEFRNELVSGFKTTELRLIEWHPIEIVDVNGMPAIKISYTRQLRNEPVVFVNLYKFQNNDRLHSLTISYRIEEKTYWLPALNEVLDSFRITNIR